MTNNLSKISPLPWIGKLYPDPGLMIGGTRFDMSKYPFLKELYHDKVLEQEIIVRKAAQLGWTTWAILVTLWYLDNDTFDNNGLYIFPTRSTCFDFVGGRLDPIISRNELLSAKNIDISNRMLKQIGGRNLYFRGTESEAGLIELPASWIVMDEVDRFKTQGVVSLIKKRAAGAVDKYFKLLSNPTFPEVGIDALFNQSTQAEYFLKCEHCNEWQPLTLEDNVDLEHPEKGTHCRKCKKPIDRHSVGEWVHAYPEKDALGYTMSQLYSPTVTIAEIVKDFKNIKSESDRQTFFNMVLGLPYIPKGGKITDKEIARAINPDLERGDDGGRDTFMGIDVGTYLDWVVINAADQVVDWGRAQDQAELEERIAYYNPDRFVIDALPERRLSLDICDSFPDKGAVCFYTAQETDKEVGDFTLQFNRIRDLRLDRMYHKVRSANIQLPPEVVDSELANHLKNLIKVVTENNKGDKVVQFLRYGKPDHLAHALNYALIAKSSFDPPSLSYV